MAQSVERGQHWLLGLGRWSIDRSISISQFPPHSHTYPPQKHAAAEVAQDSKASKDELVGAAAAGAAAGAFVIRCRLAWLLGLERGPHAVHAFIQPLCPPHAYTGMLIAGPAVAVVGAMGAGIVAASDKGDCGEVCRLSCGLWIWRNPRVSATSSPHPRLNLSRWRARRGGRRPRRSRR